MHRFNLKQIQTRLKKIFSSNRIDVVVLNEAVPFLYHQVVKNGIRVFSRDVLITQRREYSAIQRYLDLKPMFKKMNRELYKRIDNNEFGQISNGG